MGFLSEKPVTAVTTTIDRLTSDQYSEDDLSDIVDLIEIIHIKATGPTEAARAIRKKLKYGNRHTQLRALTILDLLVQNGDKKFGPLYNDEMLLDRLRATCLDPLVDQKVKRKIQTLATVWNNQFAETRGMEGLATLIRQVPSLSGQTQVRQRKVSGSERNDTGDSYGASSNGGTSRSRATSNAKPSSRTHSRNNSASLPTPKPTQAARSSRRRGTGASQGTAQFDMVKEKPKLTTTIAEANTAATNLNNALQHINREQELSTENQRAVDCFEKCKKLRRLILRYIQVVESEEYIGSLIHANEELVASLKLYEKMSKPLGEESDSDFIDARTRRLNISDSEESDYITSDEETEPAVARKVSNPDDPFDDSHVVNEPSHLERPHY